MFEKWNHSATTIIIFLVAGSYQRQFITPWANSITLRGSIAETQEFYATRAVHENPDKYLNLNATLHSLNFDAALNKSSMIEWLKQTLDIDYQALSIKSFVHMQHEL